VHGMEDVMPRLAEQLREAIAAPRGRKVTSCPEALQVIGDLLTLESRTEAIHVNVEISRPCMQSVHLNPTHLSSQELDPKVMSGPSMREEKC